MCVLGSEGICGEGNRGICVKCTEDTLTRSQFMRGDIVSRVELGLIDGSYKIKGKFTHYLTASTTRW